MELTWVVSRIVRRVPIKVQIDCDLYGPPRRSPWPAGATVTPNSGKEGGRGERAGRHRPASRACDERAQEARVEPARSSRASRRTVQHPRPGREGAPTRPRQLPPDRGVARTAAGAVL